MLKIYLLKIFNSFSQTALVRKQTQKEMLRKGGNKEVQARIDFGMTWVENILNSKNDELANNLQIFKYYLLIIISKNRQPHMWITH